MISVTPIQEKSAQEALCALCGVPFRINMPAYEARNEKGELAGICQFTMDAGGGHIYDLATPTEGDPDDALFVMGRAALNFIDLCGVKIAFFEGEGADDALLRRIGFSADKNGRYTVCLEGFFSHPCQHC